LVPRDGPSRSRPVARPHRTDLPVQTARRPGPTSTGAGQGEAGRADQGAQGAAEANGGPQAGEVALCFLEQGPRNRFLETVPRRFFTRFHDEEPCQTRAEPGPSPGVFQAGQRTGRSPAAVLGSLFEDSHGPSRRLLSGAGHLLYPKRRRFFRRNGHGRGFWSVSACSHRSYLPLSPSSTGGVRLGR